MGGDGQKRVETGHGRHRDRAGVNTDVGVL